MINLYLAGGLHTDWQDEVIVKLPDFVNVYDPRALIGQQDFLIAIKEERWMQDTDIIFVYIEETTPSGLGSAFELGFVSAVSKTAHIPVPRVVVNEKQDKYWEWLGNYSTAYTESFEKGVAILLQYLNSMEYLSYD